MNIFLKQKEHETRAWINPSELTKYEIDIIISNKKDVFQDITVSNKFSKGSDHRMLRSKVSLNLQTERYNLAKSQRKYKYSAVKEYRLKVFYREIIFKNYL